MFYKEDLRLTSPHYIEDYRANMNRSEMLETVRQSQNPWDMIIIGGGATGLGTAVDAAGRGYRTLLLEQSDFAKGTSSKSTKLVHGGVRYLAQGNVALVRDALKERGLMRENAPHLVHDLKFIIPAYKWWEKLWYGIGLTVYDMLSGKYSFGKSQVLTRQRVTESISNVEKNGLRGGILYHDGQFDDSRLAVNLAQTAAKLGATLLNYAKVTALSKDSAGKINGVSFQDAETGETYDIKAKVVINATGPFADKIRQMEGSDVKPMISGSQGIHLVLDRKFLPGDSAIMVPKTDDGRVLFAIPWHDSVVVGTTDTPTPNITLEPRPLQEEIDFVLSHAQRYMAMDPQLSDVRSVYVGIRPLVSNPDANSTAALSRDHNLFISKGGLVNICGGKWTTYRHMGEDTVNKAAEIAGLPKKDSVTKTLKIHGADGKLPAPSPTAYYGTDEPLIKALAGERPDLGDKLHAERPVIKAQVVWAARHEMARTVEDVLSRRTRELLHNAKASIEMAPAVAAILAQELGKDQAWQDRQVAEYTELAKGYILA